MRRAACELSAHVKKLPLPKPVGLLRILRRFVFDYNSGNNYFLGSFLIRMTITTCISTFLIDLVAPTPRYFWIFEAFSFFSQVLGRALHGYTQEAGYIRVIGYKDS